MKNKTNGLTQLFNATKVMTMSQFETLVIGHQELLCKGVQRLSSDEISKCEPFSLATFYMTQNDLRTQLISENPETHL